MSLTVGFGPMQRIDGPRPIPPKYGLLPAANVAGSGVDIVPDPADRWGNGVKVWPYPVGDAEVFDPSLVGTSATPKGYGAEQPPSPDFAPMVVVFAITCTTASVPDQATFKARAVAALAAVEGAAVEKELLTGAALPANLHLSDGTSNLPLGSTPTSAVNGLAEMEAEIARSGRAGLIHVSPQVATFLHNNGLINDVGGVVKTINGTTIVNGVGYVDGATPEGATPPAGWEQWIYATGPIEIRRSEVITVPETLAEALDRGMGATQDRVNTITYLVERYYLVDYDGAVQSAVLVDRCTTDCGNPPA